VFNSGAVIAYVTLGNSSVLATVANSIPIPALGEVRLTAIDATHLAAITASGTAVLSITEYYPDNA
jgi:hypothetical protein